MMSAKPSCLIVGAGVIGLAVGARLSPRFNVMVIDKHKYIANEASSRNSEVIHAGIYYPKDSLKTLHCVRGKQMLYELLATNSASSSTIPYRQCGKFIVSSTQMTDEKIWSIHKHASSVGVPTQILSAGEMKSKLPPYVKASLALYSPTSGIINSHSLIRYLEAQILGNDGCIQLRSTVTAIEKSTALSGSSGGNYEVFVKPDLAEEYSIDVDVVINAAGLYSDDVYAMIERDPSRLDYRRIYPCRGHYYTFKAPLEPAIDHLIYPVPDPNLKGLGIHVTIDLSGRVRIGPDAEFIDSKHDYRLDETRERQEKFWRALSSYLKLRDEWKSKMKIDYVGIRSKLSSQLKPEFRDYVIEEAPDLPGFINLIGIESPGLTSCLSIAERVEEILC